MPTSPKYTIPGLTTAEGEKLAGILQERLNALIDLHLTLKHVHWNVVGPHFIAVHEMIDPHVDEVIAMVDETAERIATLGSSPQGTPGAVVAAAAGTTTRWVAPPPTSTSARSTRCTSG